MPTPLTDPFDAFLALHTDSATPLLLPNAWDPGSARIFERLGFAAIATTSSGYAATRGRLDGDVGRDEILAHAADLVSATTVPVSADLENGFADDPDGVAETVRLAATTGLAGCSVEDYSGQEDDPFYPHPLAVERVAAAAEAAHAGPQPMVLTARCEFRIRGRNDLAGTIARLQAYQEAGADVLYAPGVSDLGEISSLVAAVDRPLNVLAQSATPPVSELAAVGVRRVSVGGAIAFAAVHAVEEAAREFLERGSYGFLPGASEGGRIARDAFGARQ